MVNDNGRLPYLLTSTQELQEALRRCTEELEAQRLEQRALEAFHFEISSRIFI